MTTTMIAAPRDEVERLVKLLNYQAHPHASPHAAYWQGLLDQPAEQHQGVQVACQVEFIQGETPRVVSWNDHPAGVYFLHTNAAATAALVELEECAALVSMIAEREWAEHIGTGETSFKVEAAFTQLINDLRQVNAKLAARDALLRECQLTLEKAGYGTWQIDELLSASAEQSTPTTPQIAAHRLINALGEVMTDWHDGPPPARITSTCGVEQTDVTVELAYAGPTAPVECNERADFEAWATRNGIATTRTPQAMAFHNGQRRDAGDYILKESLCAHAAWMARAARDNRP